MSYKSIEQAYKTVMHAEETGRILEKTTIMMFYEFISRAETPVPAAIQEKINQLQQILENHGKEQGITLCSKVRE